MDEAGELEDGEGGASTASRVGATSRVGKRGGKGAPRLPPDPSLLAVTEGKPLHQPAALAPQRPGSANFVLKWVPPSELGKGKKKGGKGKK